MKKNNGIVMKFYRMERWCYLHHLYILAKIIYRYIYLQFNCQIPYTTIIEEDVEIVHGIGIVLHQNSVIGGGTKIYQNVTIGNAKGPIVGRNCIIGAGACLLGNIKIGNNCSVGANAVVLNDVPDNCTVVGIPGRVVRIDGKRVETK